MPEGRRTRPGLFVAIEGGEGAGKGTLASGIVALLGTGAQQTVVATHEPGGTSEGLALRRLLLGREGEAWEPWSELLLMTAARVQHVSRVIGPALAQGRLVVCDRFVGSTLAYQGAGRGLPAAAIMRLHQDAVGGLMPDLTLLLDVEPGLGLGRSLRRLVTSSLDEDRFERLKLEFHERVRRDFLAQAAASPARHVVIDAARPAVEVVEQACAAITARLGAA